MPRKKGAREGSQFAFYMDLLGHDVINSNQAVLSYLELIYSYPAADKKIKAFAEKALTHVRTSTLLVENVKRLIATQHLNLGSMKPVDLMTTVEQARLEVSRFYPGKRIMIEFESKPQQAMAVGDSYAADLILSVILTAVRLDPGDDVNLRIDIKEGPYNERKAWVMKLEDSNITLPPYMNGGGVEETYSQDISTAVRTTGMLFAQMVAKNLGGNFEAHGLVRGQKRSGAVFVVTLIKAGGTQ
jgi:light-regulated signal transduction histidine kinase (bacteriophytochrome)